MTASWNETGLQVDVLSADRVAFARVAGELDARTAPELITAIQPLIDAGARDVVLDCGSLAFCDSMGLRALVVICRALPDGGSCTLARPRPLLRRLVEVAGLGGHIEMTGPSEAG